VRHSHHATWNRREHGLRYTMALGAQLGRSRRRTAERIYRDRQMSIRTDCVEQRRCAGGCAKCVRTNRCLTCGTRPAEPFGETEELAPGFIYRRRIALVCVVNFGDVAVVEDARYGFATHGPQFNPFLLRFSRTPRQRGASAERDAERVPVK